MPNPAEVEELYRAASEPPPLNESAAMAALFARLYGRLRGRDDLVAVEAREGAHLAGFAYGHPWVREDEDDAWTGELLARLGDAADLLDGSVVVYFLAVHPKQQGTGLGRELLRALLRASGAKRAWLQTRDEPTPAMSLYLSEGWQPIGFGPEAPNGEPGRVLLWSSRAVQPRSTSGGRRNSAFDLE